MPHSLSRAGFIIAGGRSTRMGFDKAFLDFRGQTLLARALTVMRSACPHVAVVGDPAGLARFGTVIEDIYRDRGPLAGIHAALLHSSAELNLMLAVDMPFVARDLLAFLFSRAENTDALVTVPRIARGFQPLCAVYRRDFAASAEQALKAGRNKIDAVFEGLSVEVIETDELMAAGFSEQLFRNLNTPQDLKSAESDSL